MIFFRLRGRFERIAVALLMAGLLSGCTSLSEYFHNGLKVGPNYAKPAAAVQPQWIDAADKRVRSETDDLSEWWKVFRDPVLDELICDAYRQNLTLREAGFRVLQARALYGTTVGEFFPQSQTMNGSYTRTATSIASIQGGAFGSSFGGGSGFGAPSINRYFGQFTQNFGLAWELDFWGRFRRAIEASEADLDASVENYDDVIVTLLGDVANNYVQYRILQQQIDYINENAKVQRETVRIAKAKFDKGTMDSEVNLSQSEGILAQTLAQVPQKEILLRLTNNRLCVLLGRPPEDLATRLAKSSIPEAPKEVAVGIPAELLRRRPDIRRAERQAAAESARIGVAQADLYPHISINGSIGWQAPKLNKLFTPAAFQGSYGPSFQWDVLNYGRLINKVRYQQAKFDEVVAAYQNKVLTAAEEVENGMAAYLKSQEQVKFLAKSVADAKNARRIVAAQKDIGKVDYTRLAVLELNLVQQQNLLAQAQGDTALGLIQVYRALGGGWQVRCNGACDANCPIAPEFTKGIEGHQPHAKGSVTVPGIRARIGQPLAVTPTEK